jgi:hypothetical protein
MSLKVKKIIITASSIFRLPFLVVHSSQGSLKNVTVNSSEDTNGICGRILS